MTSIRTDNPRAAIAMLAGTAVVDFAALAFGWWWITIVVGLVVAVLRPGTAAVLALLAGTLLGWIGSLLWQGGSRYGEVADVAGAMALQARGMGWLVLAVTLVYAALLALTGAWLGAAARRLVRDRRAGAIQPEITPISGADSLDEKLRTEKLGTGKLRTGEDQHV